MFTLILLVECSSRVLVWLCHHANWKPETQWSAASLFRSLSVSAHLSARSAPSGGLAGRESTRRTWDSHATPSHPPRCNHASSNFLAFLRPSSAEIHSARSGPANRSGREGGSFKLGQRCGACALLGWTRSSVGTSPPIAPATTTQTTFTLSVPIPLQLVHPLPIINQHHQTRAVHTTTPGATRPGLAERQSSSTARHEVRLAEQSREGGGRLVRRVQVVP